MKKGGKKRRRRGRKRGWDCCGDLTSYLPLLTLRETTTYDRMKKRHR